MDYICAKFGVEISSRYPFRDSKCRQRYTDIQTLLGYDWRA